MIGIVDGDAFLLGAPFIPNLELMKLHSFLNKNYVSNKLLSWYNSYDDIEKIYLWAETSINLPDEFFFHPNIVVGGGKFYNYEYIPFEDLSIENSEPDVALYQNFLAKKDTFFLKAPSIIKSGFIRLESPGRFQESQLYKNGNLFIYDYKIGENESALKMNYIKTKKTVKTLYFRHPQIVPYSDLESALKIFESDVPRKIQKKVNKIGVFHLDSRKQFYQIEQLNRDFPYANICLSFAEGDNIFTLLGWLYQIFTNNKKIGFVWKPNKNFEFNPLLTSLSNWFNLIDQWNHTVIETAEEIGMKLGFLQNVDKLGLQDTKYWNLLTMKPYELWRLLHE